jgi:hypothetical protein
MVCNSCGLLIILTKLNIIIVSINVLLLAIDKSELKSPSVAGSFKWEFWLYDVNKQIFIEKLETVDRITPLCPFVDVYDMCNQFTKIFLELARLKSIFICFQ